jgi:hypothetical protein
MKFSITLANLGVYNEGELHAESILFPAETKEVAAAYNRVSYSGMNDVIIISDNAPFEIHQYEQLAVLERIGNLDEDTYEAFLILANHMSLNLACEMARRNEFRIYREVKDVGDVAYQILQEDADFQELPDFVKRHFDYDGYGEELESESSFYEDFANEALLVIHD